MRRHVPYVCFTTLLWAAALPGVLILDAGGAPPWRGPLQVALAAALVVGAASVMTMAGRQLAGRGVGLFGVRPGPVLVTDGIYGRIRNPIDVASIVLAVSTWLAFDLALGWVIPAAAAVSFVGGVGPYEDRLLLEVFGEDFTAYRQRVSKWWPRR